MNILANSPKLTVEEAKSVVHDRFGIEVESLNSLPSERDQNFLVRDVERNCFVLKVANGNESNEFLDGQNQLLRHLAKRSCPTPNVFANAEGKFIDQVTINGETHLLRLVTFIPGKPMSEIRYRSFDLLFDLGQTIAQLDDACRDFDHSAFHREFHWDLAQALTVIERGLQLVPSHRRQPIETTVQRFRSHTQPRLESLPKSVIHNDANDGNLLVGFEPECALVAKSIAGLVDFGDAVYSWTVGNLAIAVAYGMLEQNDPLAAAKQIVAGYQSKRTLSEDELACVFGLACLRLCQSAVIAAEQVANEPENEYLNVSQAAIQATLPQLATVPFEFAEHLLKLTGPEPSETAVQFDRTEKWLSKNNSQFSFPVNPVHTGKRPAPEKTLVLNLGVDSQTLPSNLDKLDEPVLTRFVFDLMKRGGADVAIGRYLEPRVLYSSSHFVGGDLATESRTVHLGIDIFAEAGTDVVAAVNGEVYFVGAINKPLDYGGLVILKHKTEHGDGFYTLYGHLNPQSTTKLKTGQSVSAGDTIARLGDPQVNGGWTPHVHFQVMHDLVGMEHEFPGVALASQMDAWSALSPDPNLILGIEESCFPESSPSIESTLQNRRDRIGQNVSLSYDAPLKIVRGWKQNLFDDNGRRFLDAYNNVPHVGHCHPHVVQAIQKQVALLNTNTRYLHDNINRLAARVAATMPDGLDVCFFVNSATEANELALRMARAYTKAQDMVVLEHAYHGHSSNLIDISPYKNAGPGGEGTPDWVHVAPIADAYRGKHKEMQSAGELFANDLANIADQITQPLCGFICESCPSVGGQIMFPPGYLKRVYKTIRAAGGLCIADDVQTGYGRLGTHMYGFQTQEVTPDIVILGKPIGNGHPLAAVVTTRRIADSFDNGMEYFSTFGGNPVSCAAGLAVLDVLENENLMANAKVVGEELLEGLLRIQSHHELIGDVRGQGFFLGVELVRDRTSLEPAAAEASFIANRMKDRGVLLGTDGPYHNVIKIRPPMCFNSDNAKQLLQQLSKCLDLLI